MYVIKFRPKGSEESGKYIPERGDIGIGTSLGAETHPTREDAEQAKTAYQKNNPEMEFEVVNLSPGTIKRK